MFNLKEVYSAIEFGNSSIKFLTGEVQNGKINILKNDVKTCETWIKNGNIVDRISLIKFIKNYYDMTSKYIKVKIEKVLLVVPTVGIETKKNSTMPFKIIHGTNEITAREINTALEHSRDASIKEFNNEEYTQVMSLPQSYELNGKEMFSAPIGIRANSIAVHAITHFMKSKALNEYKSIIEEANLEILDVVLSSYGFAYEANNQSEKRTVFMNVDTGSVNTKMNLFISGIMYKHKEIYIGGNQLNQEIARQFDITEDKAAFLKKKYSVINDEDANEIIHTTQSASVFGMTEYRVKHLTAITTQFFTKLFKEVRATIDSWENEFGINIDKVVFSGGEVQIIGVNELMNKYITKPHNIYIPSTIGARNSIYTNTLGACYYKSFWNTMLENKAYSTIPYYSSSMEKYNSIHNKLLAVSVGISKFGKSLLNIK